MKSRDIVPALFAVHIPTVPVQSVGKNLPVPLLPGIHAIGQVNTDPTPWPRSAGPALVATLHFGRWKTLTLAAAQ
jgi:hypothetical protein